MLPYSECLYVGDTIANDLVKNVNKLTELGFEITLHDKMPDVVLYREDKSYLWEYEKEVRVVKKTSAMYYDLPEKSIESVIFGNVLASDRGSIEKIAMICEKQNIEMYHVTGIYPCPVMILSLAS
ncbi:BsuBI/PstI family type II restriction endonuclease [Laedolimicola intestinihominis]|uniref:BsuBI/PstI family type II restriction endonuclease n=1 Tax=Laedolimicola intestinihominis TaxID=3133166 RepID=A0ABV1FJ33_9FIRM